jgi:hypothetical protein
MWTWFEPSDEIEEVPSVESSKVAERDRVAYRPRVRNPDGLFLVAQQASYDTHRRGFGGSEFFVPATCLWGEACVCQLFGWFGYAGGAKNSRAMLSGSRKDRPDP